MLRLVPFVLSALLLTGCSGSGSGSEDGDGEIVAGFYPLQFLAERIWGSTVENLTQPGVEPHDLDLSVRSAATISSASLLLIMKDFQPAVDKAAADLPPDRRLDVADEADLEERDGGPDPHFWQDPARMALVAQAVGAKLADLPGADRDAVQKRTDELVAQLTTLDADYERGLASCEIDTLVVNHEAFGYLGKYGLDVVAYAGLSPDAEPSAARIAEIQKLIQTKGVSTVYGETLVENRGLQAVAKDTGVKLGSLDPIEGEPDGGSDKDYLDLMRENLASIQKGNRCQS